MPGTWEFSARSVGPGKWAQKVSSDLVYLVTRLAGLGPRDAKTAGGLEMGNNSRMKADKARSYAEVPFLAFSSSA